MIERDSTVLPEPDSPTTPSVRPRSSAKLTPSTALTRPRGVRKWVFEVGDLEQRARLAAAAGLQLGHQIVASRMSKRRANQSPIRLNESTVMNSIRHGNTVAHHASSMASRLTSISLPHVGVGRLHAEPEERQPALGGDQDAEAGEATVSIVGTRLGRISRPRMRPVAGAEAARGEHELALAQAERLGTHDPRQGGDGDDAERQGDLPAPVEPVEPGLVLLETSSL